MITAQINTHRFYVWEPKDDLQQEAIIACMGAIQNFNPNYIVYTYKDGSVRYSSAFNYFSLVIKRNLQGYTLSRRKIRNNKNIEDFTQLNTQEVDEIEYKVEWDNFMRFCDRNLHYYFKYRKLSTIKRIERVFAKVKKDYRISTLTRKGFNKYLKEFDEPKYIYRDLRNYLIKMEKDYLEE